MMIIRNSFHFVNQFFIYYFFVFVTLLTPDLILVIFLILHQNLAEVLQFLYQGLVSDLTPGLAELRLMHIHIFPDGNGILPVRNGFRSEIHNLFEKENC